MRATTVFSDQQLTVTALESMELQTGSVNRGRFVIGSVRPIAVIVRKPDSTYALDMAARPVVVDDLDLPADFDLE